MKNLYAISAEPETLTVAVQTPSPSASDIATEPACHVGDVNEPASHMPDGSTVSREAFTEKVMFADGVGAAHVCVHWPKQLVTVTGELPTTASRLLFVAHAEGTASSPPHALPLTNLY